MGNNMKVIVGNLEYRGGSVFDLIDGQVLIEVGNINVLVTGSHTGATVELFPMGQGTDESVCLSKAEATYDHTAEVIEQINARFVAEMEAAAESITEMETEAMAGDVVWPDVDPMAEVVSLIQSQEPISLSKEDTLFEQKKAEVKAAGYKWDSKNTRWYFPKAA